MTKQRMTIHRGLSELKTLDDRLNKAAAAIEPSGIMQKEKKVNQHHDKKEFEDTAKADLQSFNDLLKRKNDIKSAIVASNGITEVKIGEKTMTVADAITAKDTVKFRKLICDKLEGKHRLATANLNKNNEQINANADQLALATVGGDKTKVDGEQALNIRKTYIENNEFLLVDPLKVDELVKGIREEITAFESEVDAVLSESNAVTFIEV